MKTSNFTHILFISGSSIIAGMVNYLYHPFMLRYLNIVEFGIFASLSSISNILSIFIVGVSLFLTREYSRNISNLSRIKSLSFSAFYSMSSIGIVLFVIYAFSSSYIQDYLQINELGGTLLVGLTLPTACMSAIYMAFFRSTKRFTWISFIQIATPIFKLGIGLLLVMLGFGVFGAIGGTVFAGISISFISLLYLYIILVQVDFETKKVSFIQLISKKGSGITGFVIESFLFTLLMNADILLVKNIFPPETAGVYAGIAILGKFLIFLLLSLETVYYGQIMEHTRDSVPRRLITEPLLIIIGVSILSLGATALVGEYALSLVKAELVGQGSLLILLVVYSGLLALVSLTSKILIGWGSTLVNPLLSVGAMSILMLVYLTKYTTLIAFVLLLIIPLAVLAVLLICLLWSQLSRG